MYYDQHCFDVRCEWGEKGLEAIGPGSDVVIIVDVLSFSTTVDAAVSRGAAIFPYASDDPSAAGFAEEKNARLVGKRGADKFSLSPRGMLELPVGSRLVLPSQNGGAVSRRSGAKATLAGCFRNRRAVAEYAKNLGGTIAVIPCGERWEDGTLRPSVEDWLGAGAIIELLPGDHSPEARAAAASFGALRPDLRKMMEESASGAELIERGYADDVRFATELDCSDCVPMLVDGAFVDVARAARMK